MQKFKSHKSVEQIAKKHGLDVSFIEKQLKIGEPIEHEHTKDHDLAMNIALQHLDEIPDYYTRLKKMESDAKKQVKEHCGCEDDAVNELESQLKDLKDISYDSIDKLMRRIMKKHDMTAKQLHNAFVDKHDKTPDDWIKELKEGTLHHWFKGSKSKDGKPGWVQADGSPCANEPGETKTPKCFSSARLKSLKAKGKKGESLIRSAVRRKRKEDKVQQAKSGAAKPTMVSTFAKGKKDPNYVKAEPGIKEAMELNEAQKDKPGKGSGKKDACYHKVKSRYDVWPSAYASGALVKCRKVGAANWGTKSEEIAMNDLPVSNVTNGKRYCPKCEKNELRSECEYGPTYWDLYSLPPKLKESKDHEYSMIRSELSTIRNAVHRLQKKMKTGEGNVEAWVQSKITKAADYLDTAADYVDSGEMEESVTVKVRRGILPGKQTQIARSTGAGALSPEAARQLGDKAVELRNRKLSQTELPKIRKEENEVDEMKCWKGYKKKGTQELFGKKYNRCVKAENVSIEDANGNTFAEVIDLIKPEPIKGFKSQIKEAIRLQSEFGNIISVTLLWRARYYSIQMFFPQTKIPNRQEISTEIQKVYPDSRLVHYSISDIQPGQPLIRIGYQGGSLPKPGPSKNYVKPMGEEVELDEDWQKVNRQDKTDGLSPAAVKAYRRENPGSKLQTAVTEKKPTGARAQRRKSFCSRMKGMKSKLTSAKTARDSDSNINKALRRWNCR